MTNIQNELSLKIRYNEQVARFVLLFTASLSVLYFLSIYYEALIPIFNMETTASTLYSILKFLGLNVSLLQNQVLFSNFTFEIVRECTGIFEVMAVSSCIIAYPSSTIQKTIGLMSGISLIYFFNIARLVLLSYVGVYFPHFFDAFHDYLLQLTFFFFVIIFFLVWISKVRKNEDKQ